MNSGDTANGPLRVDIITTDRRTMDGLQAAFGGPGRSRFLIVNATIAEALIVDLSGNDVDALWENYRQEFPGRPTIAIADRDISLPPGVQLVRKPLNLGELFEALDLIRRQMGAEQVFRLADAEARRVPEATAQTLEPKPPPPGADQPAKPGYHSRLDMAPDIEVSGGSANAAGQEGADKLDAAATAIIEQVRPTDGLSDIDLMGSRQDSSPPELERDKALFLRLNGYLMSDFQAALKAAVITRASTMLTVREHTMIIAPSRDLVYYRPGTDPLYQICQQPLGRHQAQVANAQPPAAEDPAWQTQSVTATLWKLALWTYQGRLPAQTDVNSRMYLAHWPNFTRLLPLPNALRITALWTEQPMPMNFTAEALGIPQRNVFAFYSAAYTIGLSGQARRDADHLFQPGSLATDKP